MSDERIEALRAMYAQWAEDNFLAGAELLAPDVVFWADPERIVYRGPEGVAEWMREFLAEWSDFRMTAEEFQVSGDRVLVLQTQSGTSVHMGHIDAKTACIWTFRDGLAVEVQQIYDRDEALRRMAKAPTGIEPV